MVDVALGRASETDLSRWITPVTAELPMVYGDLTLYLADDELDNTPANVLAYVGNGDDEETISFSITGPGGTFPGLISEDLDEDDGTIAISVPLPELTAGTYVLTVTGTVSGSTTAALVILDEALDDTEDPDDNAEPDVPVFTPDVSHRWQFIDTTVGEEDTYTLPRNPARWTNPNRPNFLEHDVTSAPDGAVLAWEGAERSWTFEFSGYLDTQAEYEAFQYWTDLRRRFWLVDHRDKIHYVTFEHFDARARIVPNKPWAHDYTVRAIHFYRDGTA